MNTKTVLLRTILIGSTLVACWLGMQAVHELGHVIGAAMTGGEVEKVVLHPLTISRTDLADNPKPLVVVWAGPILGSILPLALWGVAAAIRLEEAFLLRFFAGFCLIANGLYIAAGSFDGVGDCGDMLRHGAPIWTLWLFGLLTTPLGLALWHSQGKHFGVSSNAENPTRRTVVATVTTAVLLTLLGLAIGR